MQLKKPFVLSNKLRVLKTLTDGIIKAEVKTGTGFADSQLAASSEWVEKTW